MVGRGLALLPRPWRDWAYDRIARNRYRLLGRACLVPDPAWRARILDGAGSLPARADSGAARG